MKIKVEFILYYKFLWFKYNESRTIVYEKNLEEANYMIRNFLNFLSDSVYFEVEIDEKLTYIGKIMKNTVDIRRV